MFDRLTVTVTVNPHCHALNSKVGSVLSNLKEMSQAMGGEIERQNKQLDKIGGKTDVADVNIGRANTRTEKILKK